MSSLQNFLFEYFFKYFFFEKGLKINKIKLLIRTKNEQEAPITTQCSEIKDINELMYLVHGSKIRQTGGTEEDNKAKITIQYIDRQVFVILRLV